MGSRCDIRGEPGEPSACRSQSMGPTAHGSKNSDNRVLLPPNIFTARVRSTTEKHCFHRYLYVDRGYPSLWSQVPSQPLVESPFWGGGEVPQSCHKYCLGSPPGHGHPQLGLGYPLAGTGVPCGCSMVGKSISRFQLVKKSLKTVDVFPLIPQRLIGK